MTTTAMTDAKKLRIGDVLLQERLITQEQLETALVTQKQLTVYKPLGEVCIDLEYITRVDLKKVVRKFRKRIVLGDLLLNLGLINKEQLDQALELQAREGGQKLGKLLIKKGIVSEVTLVDVLSVQLGIPKITPSLELIDQSLMTGLKQEFLTRHEFIPIVKINNVLTVVMADPINEETLRELERFFDCDIEPAIATANDIHNAIAIFFSRRSPKPKSLVIGTLEIGNRTKDNVIEILNYVISNAITERASDIHIEPLEYSLRVRFRIDGILQHKTDLPSALTTSLISRIKILSGMDITEKRRHQDGRIEARILEKEVDLRVSTYSAIWGENVVIRILHRQSTMIGIDKLGFNPTMYDRFMKLLDYPSGVILVTGPTGSGKTTTLYSALHYLNDQQKVIITVEDPVEYTLEGVIQGRLDPKLELSYMDFIKTMMRQDPDVIMVGEIRDRNAAEATIQAALTGHKVFSTFHTEDTTGALLRLMDMGIDTFLISSTVVSVLAQRLVRKLCEKCKQPHPPEPELLASFHIDALPPGRFNFCRPRGCIYCNNTGYLHRVGIHEMLVVNDAVRDAILARMTSSQIRVVARKRAGLISMREDGFYKASQGITTLEEVVRVVFYNESDSYEPRGAEDIFKLCTDISANLSDIGLPGEPTAHPKPPAEPPVQPLVVTPAGASGGEGSVLPLAVGYSPAPTLGALPSSTKSMATIMRQSPVLPPAAPPAVENGPGRSNGGDGAVDLEGERFKLVVEGGKSPPPGGVEQLFVSLQQLRWQLNDPLDPATGEEFGEFIAAEVARLRNDRGAGRLEIVLHKEGERARLVARGNQLPPWKRFYPGPGARP